MKYVSTLYRFNCRFLVGFVLLDIQFYLYVFVDRCLSFCVFFFCPLNCLFFFDIRILINPLVSSNSTSLISGIFMTRSNLRTVLLIFCCLNLLTLIWPSCLFLSISNLRFANTSRYCWSSVVLNGLPIFQRMQEIESEHLICYGYALLHSPRMHLYCYQFIYVC